MKQYLLLFVAIWLGALAAHGEDTYVIKSVAFTGDTAFLKSPNSTAEISQRFAGNQTEASIEAGVKTLNDSLIDQGFYLANLTAEYDRIDEGILTLTIDQGRLGKINYYRLPGGFKGTDVETRQAKRQPYRGYFGADQLNAGFQPQVSRAFNYNDLHLEIFRLNALPDLSVDTDMKVREEADEKSIPRRYVDLDFYVQDRLPIHGVSEIKNTGTRRTDEERIDLTLQHLNLTKHNDTLSFNLLGSLDMETLRTISSSYNFPIYNGGLSLTAGYSDLKVDEVVSGIDLAADGWFVGNRNFHHLFDNSSHTLNVAYGIQFTQLSDSLILNQGVQVKTDIQTAPVSAGLIYHSNKPDLFNGRNFLTLLVTQNAGDAFGVTKEAEVQAIREDAAADYNYAQLQGSRIQSIGGKIDDVSGEQIYAHYIFANFDLQYSGEPLLSADKKVVGGLESVRGYPENFVAGDNGFSGKLEVRTLIFKGALTKWLGRNKNFDERRRYTADYIQLTGFLDGAYVEDEATTSIPSQNATLLGVGAGLRFSVTGNSQLKLDYGYPIEDAEGASKNGRLHFAFETQF
jgi:hemolysin activation/secretion protein